MMRYITIFVLVVFIVGCSYTTPAVKETKLVLIKSPKIKYHDIGYLEYNNDDIKLSLYNAGASIGTISIGYLVCTKQGCLSKSKFNETFLNKSYPKNILKHILLGKPIFDGKNLIKNHNGFIQKIKSKEFAIVYKVVQNEIFFKDKTNHITIKLKDIR